MDEWLSKDVPILNLKLENCVTTTKTEKGQKDAISGLWATMNAINTRRQGTSKTTFSFSMGKHFNFWYPAEAVWLNSVDALTVVVLHYNTIQNSTGKMALLWIIYELSTITKKTNKNKWAKDWNSILGLITMQKMNINKQQ